MAPSIPNLWPSTIKTDILTPLAILRAQANALSQATEGLLEARVDSGEEKGKARHDLYVLAPALDCEHAIVRALHDPEMVYPVQLNARVALRSEEPQNMFSDVECTSDSAFLAALKNVLESQYVTSVVQSLIARSNERKADQESQPP